MLILNMLEIKPLPIISLFLFFVLPKASIADARFLVLAESVIKDRIEVRYTDDGRTFNVKPPSDYLSVIVRHNSQEAAFYPTGKVYRIKGHISHDLKHRSDDQYHYTIDIHSSGDLLLFRENVHQGGIGDLGADLVGALTTGKGTKEGSLLGGLNLLRGLPEDLTSRYAAAFSKSSWKGSARKIALALAAFAIGKDERFENVGSLNISQNTWVASIRRGAEVAVLQDSTAKFVKVNPSRRFHFHPPDFSTATQGSDLVVIAKGKISHTLRLRPDDQYSYRLAINNKGQILDFTEKIERGGFKSIISDATFGGSNSILNLLINPVESLIGIGATAASKGLNWIIADGPWEEQAQVSALVISQVIAENWRKIWAKNRTDNPTPKETGKYVDKDGTHRTDMRGSSKNPYVQDRIRQAKARADQANKRRHCLERRNGLCERYGYYDQKGKLIEEVRREERAAQCAATRGWYLGEDGNCYRERRRSK